MFRGRVLQGAQSRWAYRNPRSMREAAASLAIGLTATEGAFTRGRVRLISPTRG